jgi:hypothetical protein
MRSRLDVAIPVIACCAAAFGCAAATSEPSDDRFAAAPIDDGEPLEPDETDAFTYVALTGDPRACAGPACGGYVAERVNRQDLTCADGATSPTCYVAAIDWSATGLSDDTVAGLEAEARRGGDHVLLRGDLEATADGLGVLVVREAWRAIGDGDAGGVIVRIQDAGIRCITAPCESMHEQKLNSQLAAMIADVDTAAVDAAEDEIAAARMAIDAGGLLAAGARTTVTGPAGEGRALAATQLWTRVTPAPSDCFVGGCGRSICSDRPDQVSTCEWKPEYACYQDAVCERQPSGVCGWTMTDELQACLAAP